jgi:hypothetical protein
MREDKRYLVAMIRRRLIALKKATDPAEEQGLFKEIKELMGMLSAVIS